MKRLSAIIAALIIAISMDGCAGNGSRSTSGPDNSVDNNIKEYKVDFKGKSIKINSPFFVKDEQIISDAEAKFNCKLQIETEFKNYDENIVRDLLAGTCSSDIVGISNSIHIVQLFKNNVILPIDDYVDIKEDEKIDRMMFSGSLWQGKHYGISMGKTYVQGVMTYNRQMIKENGLPDPYDLQEKCQWNWDAFINIVTNTTKDINGDGLTDIWGVIISYPDNFVRCLMYSNGISLAQEGEQGRFICKFNSPEGISSLTLFHNLCNVYKVVYLNESKPPSDEKMFDNNKAAILPGTSSSQEIGRYGLVFYPKGPYGSEYRGTTEAGYFCAIPSTVKNPREIAVVLEYYCRKYQMKHYKELSFYSGVTEEYLKVFRKCWEAPRYVYYEKYPPFETAFKSMVAEILKRQHNIKDIIDYYTDIAQRELDKNLYGAQNQQ